MPSFVPDVLRKDFMVMRASREAATGPGARSGSGSGSGIGSGSGVGNSGSVDLRRLKQVRVPVVHPL